MKKRKNKRDILFLCQFFYPEYVTAARLSFDTAKALKKEGFSVGALCGYPKEYNNVENVPVKELVDGIFIRRLKYVQTGRRSFIGRLVNYFSFTFSVLMHFRELGKYKCIVVYSNPPILPYLAYLAKKIYGTKLIFVAYDLYPELAVRTSATSESGIITKVMKFINRKVYKNANCVVALSNEMKEFIVKNRAISSKRVAVIPNWYEDNLSNNKSNKVNNKFAEKYAGKLVVSYFGNMGVCQDMETIIDTMRILKDNSKIQFMFAGHGCKVEELKSAIQKEQIKNVDVYDFLLGQDYQDALEISDVSIVSLLDGLSGLCVPSKTYSYMSVGCPIIAIMDESDIVRDIKDRNMGFAVKNGNSQDMAEFLLKLLEDRSMRVVMAENSRMVFTEKYTREICTQKYVKLLSKIAQNDKDNRLYLESR